MENTTLGHHLTCIICVPTYPSGDETNYSIFHNSCKHILVGMADVGRALIRIPQWQLSHDKGELDEMREL